VEEETLSAAFTETVTPKFRVVKKEVKPKNEDPRLHAVFDRNA
jgi:hypothetical protein